MRPGLLAVMPGPYVTVQDAGRRGWQRFGVSRSGAMDRLSLAAANALVGNHHDAAALEFAHVGGTWQVAAESARIAITGGSFEVAADGVALQPWRSHTLRRGQRLSIKGASDAVWGYLAIAHGFDLVPQLGSCATHLRSGMGGTGGRRIEEGDTIPLQSAYSPDGPELCVAPPHHETGPLRVLLGPQEDYFRPESIASFLGSNYLVTHRSDRMGTWLDGPKLSHIDGYNIISDGIVPGSVQVPGVGQPVVLMMDCQTIGGYPKLATIITADLPRFAQTRPGTSVSFDLIEIEDAHLAYRSYQSLLGSIVEKVQPVPQRMSLPFWLRG